ncbi:hypothetical protein [Pedobacter sp. MC2016-24]|uniref:hypothetical protein n=1 Tax=Pedobacter sp. MC2016-24 TaxID=2780090 RepID=UPI00187F7F78|nr:hypothetical protein [Pedobacter sp. MC2016-24]MBE9597776.1 hypothetical protein [Pedobacter sp. MC2016-24]
MKIDIKKIFLFSIILIAIVILPDINMYRERYKLRSQKLPEIYKNQTELEHLKDDDYEVIKIKKNAAEPIIQANDSTIVIFTKNSKDSEKGSSDYENIWYKINLKGQITDSLKYSYNSLDNEHDYHTFNNYIIDTKQNTYSNWIKNNDTRHYAFKNMNENKIFTKEEADKITSEGKIMQIDYSYLGDNGIDSKNKVIIFKNGVWNYFYTEKNWHESANYTTNEFQAQFYYPIDKELVTAPTAGNEKKSKQIFFDINNPKSIIYREYVFKEKWNENSFWYNIMNWHWGSGNTSSSGGWTGSSYFSIKMPKKTLHYKQAVYIDSPDESLRDHISYSVYKPKNGEYILLDSYLIRPK